MKKCPFCGEIKYIEWMQEKSEEMESKSGDYRIQCLTCKALGPPAESRTEAEELWNKRIK